MNTISHRIAVLDGLRALAIILVVLRHAVRPFWPELSDPYIPIGGVDLGAIFINGWMGVDLFFVLSGFLIADHLMKSFSADGARFWGVLKDYAPRRFFRIAPVYYVVLFAAVIGLFPFYPYPESHEGIVWRSLYHMAFMQDYWPSDIVVVFWSLAIEIKFYLLAPFLVFGLMRVKNIGVQAGILLALILSQPLLRGGFAPDVVGFEEYFLNIRSIFHFCLDGLLCGVLAAFLWNHDGVKARLQKPVVATGLFGGGLAGFLALSFAAGPLVDVSVSGFDKTWLVSVIAAAFTAMLLGLMGGAKGACLFRGRALTFIALISYSLYLVHLPLLYVAEVMAGQVFDLGAMDNRAAFAVYLPFFAAVSVGVSTLLYVAVERPIIMWSKKKYGRKP